jgi:DNA-binding MarR family transcriptional regulator
MAIERSALDDLLGFRLRRVNQALARGFTAATGDHGLRAGEFTSLAVIASNPGISQNAVCHATGLDKSAAVAVIDDLLRRGWIARERAAEDRRRALFSVTAQGERALDDLVARTRVVEAPVLAALTRAERTTLFALLDKLVEQVLDNDK